MPKRPAKITQSDIARAIRAAEARLMLDILADTMLRVGAGLRAWVKWVGGADGRVEPMIKKSWTNKFKKYAVLAGINEPRKSCHGVRNTRVEATAYADCTEAQMMAMFGWSDPKMPAHYIAKAKRDKLGLSGMEKLVSFDSSQNENLDEFMPLRTVNAT